MLAYYLDLALRSLKRNKVLTALMVLAIAVGIGASMTTLTVVHVLSGDPLPGRSAHIFFPQVDPTPASWGRASHPLEMMDERSALDLWSAHRADRQALIVQSPVKVSAPGVDHAPLMLSMQSTTSDFFPMFDVPFAYGAPWTSADDQGRARVAVISADLNDRLFDGGDSVGKTIRIRGSDVRIVGVLKPWRPSPMFYDPEGSVDGNMTSKGNYGRPEDVFMPFSASLEVNDGHFFQYTCWGQPTSPGHLEHSPCLWVALWVELDSPSKVAAYRAFLGDYARQQKAMGRFAQTDTRMLDLMQWLRFEQVVPSDVTLQMWLAFAFLAICLFNTVGLLLAKFLRRSGEIGVRRALGASRREIFTQCLIEAGLIGFIGGAGGWLLSLLGLWLVRRQQAPYADLVHMDVAMFVVTFALSIAVSLLAGALPAMRASRITPALQLKTL
ncbi:ABC transporter permease [Dyella sp. A6]|uniref:ABC transporter permease n=1 Tax=Dyella aluminiiresistens TaxID=3069105 RepID=UPI002E7A5DFA|nr:ABC transporter permease [Dyella sp. A6]